MINALGCFSLLNIHKVVVILWFKMSMLMFTMLTNLLKTEDSCASSSRSRAEVGEWKVIGQCNDESLVYFAYCSASHQMCPLKEDGFSRSSQDPVFCLPPSAQIFPRCPSPITLGRQNI